MSQLVHYGAKASAPLTKAMPRLLRGVRAVVGERKVTIVFDCGGWSPQLFAAMIKGGFDVLTYRMGHCRRINERRFIRRRAKLDGRLVDYLPHDQPVRFLRLRQVTRLCDGGHQTNVDHEPMGPARHRRARHRYGSRPRALIGAQTGHFCATLCQELWRWKTALELMDVELSGVVEGGMSGRNVQQKPVMPPAA